MLEQVIEESFSLALFFPILKRGRNPPVRPSALTSLCCYGNFDLDVNIRFLAVQFCEFRSQWQRNREQTIQSKTNNRFIRHKRLLRSFQDILFQYSLTKKIRALLNREQIITETVRKFTQLSINN